MTCAIGYLVEAVACPKDFYVVLRFDKRADLFNGVGRVQTFGAVFEIACPICQFRRRQPGEEWGHDGTSHHRREDFDEVSFVHSQGLKRRNRVGGTSGFGQDNGDHLTLVPFFELLNRGQWKNRTARQMPQQETDQGFRGGPPCPSTRVTY